MTHRGLMVALAAAGLLAAGYLTLVQVGVPAAAWDPVFGEHSARDVLELTDPVPDAAAGVAAYATEVVLPLARRGRLVLGLVLAAGGLTSVALIIIIRPAVVGAWCLLDLRRPRRARLRILPQRRLRRVRAVSDELAEARSIAEQQPGPPTAPEVPGALQPRQCSRDRWATTTDKMADQLMRERQVKPHAIGTDAPVSIGEFPEEQPQAVLKPVMLGDRQHRCQTTRPDHHPPRDLRRDFGKRRHPSHPVEIEDRQAKRRQHPPGRLKRQRRLLAVVLSQLQKIPGAQQFGAEATLKTHAPHENAPHHQQPQAIAPMPGVLPRLPQPGIAPQHPRHAESLRVLTPRPLKSIPELRVDSEHRHALGSPPAENARRHATSLPNDGGHVRECPMRRPSRDSGTSR